MSETPGHSNSSRPRFVPPHWGDLGLLVPPALAALAASRGRTGAAAALALATVVIVVLRIVAGDLVARTTARVGLAAQRWLTWLVLTGFWLVVVLPVWCLRRLTRADRRRDRAGAGASSWVATPDPSSATRTFAAPGVAPRHPGAGLVTALGAVLLLLAVDIGIGLAWQGFTRSELTRPIARPLGLARDGTFEDPRASSPALRDSPWAAQQLREMQRLPRGYWPFELFKPLPFRSETLDILGWERRSYQAPEAADPDVPVVAFFGGSTMFGEDQRDEHTIPSEIARLAEEAGTPVRVINYGQRAWSAWEEALLFEQMSSDPDDPDHPDLVVFYDGWNDVSHQQQDSTAGWPSHFAVDGIAELLTGAPAGQATTEADRSASLARELRDWYTSHSVIFRGLRALRSPFEDPPSEPTSTLSSDPPEVVGERAAEVYGRAADFVTSTAERRGIEPLLFWQPSRNWRTDVAYAEATRLVSRREGTEVIADVLDDHPEVFVDDIHTNEDGARIVAERIWESLEEPVRRAS